MPKALRKIGCDAHFTLACLLGSYFRNFSLISFDVLSIYFCPRKSVVLHSNEVLINFFPCLSSVFVFVLRITIYFPKYIFSSIDSYGENVEGILVLIYFLLKSSWLMHSLKCVNTFGTSIEMGQREYYLTTCLNKYYLTTISLLGEQWKMD